MPGFTPSLGTAMSVVSAEPPNADKSIGRMMWRSAPSGRRHPARSVELDPVTLVVIDRQRIERTPLGARGGRGHHRIETARDEDDSRGRRRRHGGPQLGTALAYRNKKGRR